MQESNRSCATHTGYFIFRTLLKTSFEVQLKNVLHAIKQMNEVNSCVLLSNRSSRSHNAITQCPRDKEVHLILLNVHLWCISYLISILKILADNFNEIKCEVYLIRVLFYDCFLITLKFTFKK